MIKKKVAILFAVRTKVGTNVSINLTTKYFDIFILSSNGESYITSKNIYVDEIIFN